MSVEYKGYTINVMHDDDPMNPRDNDNLGTMVCFHNRYKLGDDHNFEVEEAKILENSDKIIALPVYMYDHGGITINVHPFSCRWDSCKLGFIYVTKEKVRKEYDKKLISPELKRTVERVLKAEVEEYDFYLRGESYFYTVEKNGETIDECGGFTSEDDAETEAKDSADWHYAANKITSKEEENVC